MSEPVPVRLAVRSSDELRQETIVKQLEELLEEVRKGDVDSVMLIAEYRDSPSPSFWCSGSPDLERTIARLEVMKHGQILRFLDPSE
jgi:hypothetical protein